LEPIYIGEVVFVQCPRPSHLKKKLVQVKDQTNKLPFQCGEEENVGRGKIREVRGGGNFILFPHRRGSYVAGLTLSPDEFFKEWKGGPGS
jgi:hypothetical protein